MTYTGTCLSQRNVSVLSANHRIPETMKSGNGCSTVLVEGESSVLVEQCMFPRTLGKYRFLLAATQSLPVAKTLAFNDPRLEAETTNE